MTEEKKDKTYLFDARRATIQYPEANRYCCSLLPAIAKLLRKEEHLHIITSEETRLPEISPRQKVTLHCTHLPSGSFSASRYMKKLTKEISPDIYHSASLYDYCTKKVNSIATIHQNCALNKKASQSTWLERLHFLSIVKPRLHRYNTFISISNTLLETYEGTEICKRNVVIPYGVGPQFKPSSQEEIDAVREKYFLPPRFLLMITASESTRNLNAVLDAMKSMDFTESAPLVIAGYKSKSENITKLIEQRDLKARVHQTGPIDDEDMPALYSAAYTLLFPNIIKGTGLPVMEAMACGTPVICSSLPVLVELAGNAATLVHPTDKLEWRRAISTALVSITWHEDSREAALEHAKLFTWEKAAEETLKLYRQS